MRVLFLGNGFEVNFQENLSKNKIIENALYGEILHKGEALSSIYPAALKNFCKLNRLDYDNLLPTDLKNIKRILLSEHYGKSIEDIFIEVINSIDKGNEDLIKKIFLRYINNYSQKIKISELKIMNTMFDEFNNKVTVNDNITANKLKSYDLIITTNYTDLIFRIAPEMREKIIYLHGKIGDSDNSPLLGDKTSSEKETIEFISKNLNLIRDKICIAEEEFPDASLLTFDMFGWSFDNEADILFYTLSYLMHEMVRERFNIKYYPAPWGVNQTSIVQKIKTVINYYGHTEDDKLKAGYYKTKGIQIRLPIISTYYDVLQERDSIIKEYIGENLKFENLKFNVLDSTSFFTNKKGSRVIWFNEEKKLIDIYEAIELKKQYDFKLSSSHINSVTIRFTEIIENLNKIIEKLK